MRGLDEAGADLAELADVDPLDRPWILALALVLAVTTFWWAI